MATGVLVGCATAAGVDVALVDGIAVGWAVGNGVAVADEPQATITASRRVKDPKTIAFGVFNQ
jgi:hypothetical protein